MARVQVQPLTCYADNLKPGLFFARSWIQPLSDVYFYGVSSGDKLTLLEATAGHATLTPF
jgi:hypothetical protein